MSDLFGNEKMLALSWKQPFGSAMLIGKIETRVWSTKYRGLVLICLSKVGYNNKDLRTISGEEQFQKLRESIFPAADTVNCFGMAIAVGRLVDCREMRPDDEARTFVAYRAPWVEDREGKDGIVRRVHRRLYCHVYEDVRRIVPFPWKGSQGWAAVPNDIISQIKYHSTTGKPDNI